jgi:ribosomal protein S18 acetylase RimI-like enzyme
VTIATRPAGAADVDLVAGVFLVALRDAITASRGAWDEVCERAQFLDQLDLAGTRVIEVAGRVAGFATVVARSGAAVLHTLCVLPEFQGRGVGASVTRDLVRQSHAEGRDVVLSVLKSNPRARGLYARLGFVVDGESAHHDWMRHPVARAARHAEARAARPAGRGRPRAGAAERGRRPGREDRRPSDAVS